MSKQIWIAYNFLNSNYLPFYVTSENRNDPNHLIESETAT